MSKVMSFITKLFGLFRTTQGKAKEVKLLIDEVYYLSSDVSDLLLEITSFIETAKEASQLIDTKSLQHKVEKVKLDLDNIKKYTEAFK